MAERVRVMRQEQKVMTGIYFSESFTAGALSGRLYQMTQPSENFTEDVAYVVRSSGIPLAWLATDGKWHVTENDYGKTFARHRGLVRKAIEFRTRREGAA
jgi:nicotinamide mononucleotide (NMN) deamidase PncC